MAYCIAEKLPVFRITKAIDFIFFFFSKLIILFDYSMVDDRDGRWEDVFNDNNAGSVDMRKKKLETDSLGM